MRSLPTARRHFLLAPLAAAALLLSGCATPSTDTTKTPQAASAETVSAGGATATDTAAPDSTASPQAGADCIEGSWSDDPGWLTQDFEAANAGDPNATVQVAGDKTTTYADGTVTVTYANLTIDKSMSWADGQVLTASVRYDGTVTGQYTSTGTSMTITGVDESALKIGVDTAVDGVATELTEWIEGAYDATKIDYTYSYTCTAEELALLPTPDARTSDVALVLHRR